jgi:ligand-binding sensor domain-containing protein
MYRYFLYSLLIFILIIPVTAWSQGKRFFDYNEGLSNSLINKVYQDHLGFIWVATEDGLNRFDGMKFNVFSHDPNNNNSLKSNYVTSLTEDLNGNLLVGLINGVQIFHHETETFKDVEFFVSDERIHPYVSSIVASKNGNIWIATSGFGLIVIDKEVGRPRHSAQLNKRLNSIYLQTLYEDKDGILWIGTVNDGLKAYNPKTDEIKTYSKTSNFPYSPSRQRNFVHYRRQ